MRLVALGPEGVPVWWPRPGLVALAGVEGMGRWGRGPDLQAQDAGSTRSAMHTVGLRHRPLSFVPQCRSSVVHRPDEQARGVDKEDLPTLKGYR